MTDKPKATPRPWKVVQRDDYWKVVDANDARVFDDGSACGEYRSECSVETRDFILQSVNDRAALLAKVERLEKEIEIQAWNLGGCSTYALGYGLEESHDKTNVRPALDDVLKLALREKALRERVKSLEFDMDRIVHELGVPQSGYPAPVANAYEIAASALGGMGNDRR